MTTAQIAGLTGTVLEIGAGDGDNLGRLPRSLDWIGLEPNRRRRAALTRAAVAHGFEQPVLAARAEQIPLPDNSVDVVLSTLALCSVTDQPRALAELLRVLRPGGRLIFHEHVAAPPRTIARARQRAWAPLSRRFDHGCDPARDTVGTIVAAGFGDLDVQWWPGRRSTAIYAPFVSGVAVAGSG